MAPSLVEGKKEQDGLDPAIFPALTEHLAGGLAGFGIRFGTINSHGIWHEICSHDGSPMSGQLPVFQQSKKALSTWIIGSILAMIKTCSIMQCMWMAPVTGS